MSGQTVSPNKELNESQKKSLFIYNIIAGVLHLVLLVVFFSVSVDYWVQGKDFKGIDTSTYVTQPVFSRREPNPDEQEDRSLKLDSFRADQVSATNEKVIPLMCCLFVLITAVFHITVATWKKKQYHDCLKSGTNPFRWIEYSITASIMFYIVLASLGMRDFNAILVAIPLCSIIMIIGLFIEEYAHGSTRKDMKRAWFLTAVAWLGFFALWSVLISSFTRSIDAVEKARNPFGELSQEMQEFRIFLWIGFMIILVFYASFGAWQTGNMLKKTSGAFFREKGYIILSFCSKVSLVILLFWGLYGRSSADNQ